MTQYNLPFNGAQINEAIEKARVHVVGIDTAPQQGSNKVVNSDGIYTAVNAKINTSDIVTEAQTIAANDVDTKVPSAAAVKDYVDNNIKSLATGWTDIAATGTAATDGFIVAYVPGDSDDDANIQVTVGGYTVRSGPLSGGSELNNATVTMPIASGETWTISGSGSGSVVRKFKAFS